MSQLSNEESMNNEKKRLNLWQKWCDSSLIIRIIGGLALGVGLALILPSSGSEQWSDNVAGFVEMFGTLFVTALKSIAPLLVFVLVISSIANARSAGNIRTVLILYALGTATSAILAVIATSIFPITIILPSADSVEQSAPSSIGEVLTNILTGMVSNPIEGLAEGSFLCILIWATVLGIALRLASPGTKKMLKDLGDAITVAVKWVINCAPLGIMGLVFTSFRESGAEIFTSYGELVLLLVSCMLIGTFIINPIIVFFCIRKNPYPLVWRTIKDSYITAFFARSSAANIPVNLRLCEKLGLDEEAYSISIPLGATINMGGAAITISVMSMCAAYTLGIQIDPVTAFFLCLLASVSAAGASGVAGGSLLLIPLACSLFGIDSTIAMEVVAIGFIIGVIQDSFETAQNSSTDVLFTATADYMKQIKEGKEVHPGKDA